MANIYVAAQSTWNGKALKTAKKEISVFDRQVKSLGKTFAGVFGARALYNYSKKAINAFAADEKAAKALETQLKNTGFAFAAPSVESYINNLQKLTGVLDDQLRPAFQSLLTVTGSITKSQKGLALALDISAATGRSVEEVSLALAKGYAGQTTALSRLGAGISKAALKTGDMEQIMAELQAKFSGQAAARLDTYAGKLDLIKVGAADATEIIGEGLVNALIALGKDQSIEDLTDNMNNLAKGIANVVAGVGELSGVLIDLRNTGGIKQLLDVLTFGNIFQLLGYLGGTSTAQPKSNFTYELGASATKDIERANEILRIKNANKLRAEENARIKAKNELDKLKEKYDVERIGLMLALNQATDEETRLRIAEKLAILDGNAAKAAQYLAETELTFQANQLAQSMNKAANAALYFSDWATYRAGERGDASIVSSAGGGGAVGVSSIPAPSMTMASDYAAYRAGERGDINITVEGSILSDQDLTDTIQRTILQINKQGRGTTPAGGLSGGT